jgi:hypothetical protein
LAGEKVIGVEMFRVEMLKRPLVHGLLTGTSFRGCIKKSKCDQGVRESLNKNIPKA